jgi:hypothetical protein
MVQNYQDAMAIYRWAVARMRLLHSLTIPLWPDIKRALLLGQQPQDRSDSIT